MKEVNCQFTFGVFTYTKWDVCLKKAKEKREGTVDVEETRKNYETKFRDSLKNQCEVFFVDGSECVENIDVSLLLLLFFLINFFYTNVQ